MAAHVYCYVRAHQLIAHGGGREKRNLKGAKKAPVRVNLFFQVGFAQGSIQSTSNNFIASRYRKKRQNFPQVRDWRDWELMSFHCLFFSHFYPIQTLNANPGSCHNKNNKSVRH